MDLEEAIERFLDERDGDTRTLATHGLSYFARWFLDTNGEELTLSNWTNRDIRDYQAYLVTTKRKADDTHLAPSTVNTYLSPLRSFCNWCLDNRLMERNPVPRKLGLRIQPGEVTVLDRNQENKLLRILEGEDASVRFIILFLMNTGLRNSELVKLELLDVWLGEEGRTLNKILDNVPEAKAFRSGMVKVRDGKGHVSREVDLNAEARAALLDYLKVRPHSESERVLISLKTRAPMTKWGVIEVCRKFTPLMGTRIHAHLFRHGVGTKVTNAASIVVAANVLGHRDLNTTRKAYVGISAVARKNALDNIGEA